MITIAYIEGLVLQHKFGDALRALHTLHKLNLLNDDQYKILHNNLLFAIAKEKEKKITNHINKLKSIGLFVD